MILRITFVGSLALMSLALSWELGAQEPKPIEEKPSAAPTIVFGAAAEQAAKEAATEKEVTPEAKAAARAKLIERLKKFREKGGDAPAEGQGAMSKIGDRLKGLGKRGEPLDMTKFKRLTFKVGDVQREAILYVPPVKDGASKTEKRPLVFAFHGHGGTAEHAARRMAFHELWPEAVSIYPQGLPTAVPQLDPQGRMPGWQKYVGDQDDRDIAFFDVMLKQLIADYQVDDRRVYSCGHSNGGFFTYVLLPSRGDVLAAVAPIAATLDVRNFKDQKPKPVFHVAGERDPLVRYAGQERTIEQICKLNGCDAEGKFDGKFMTTYSSKSGPPVVAWLHPGGHEIPEGSLEKITEFFQQHVRK